MIEKIKKFFTERQKRRKQEEEKFYSATLALGFDKIEFPIIIQDGLDLSIVSDKAEFFGDPDIYFFEFEPSIRLIDSNGRQFTWAYNAKQKSNYPDAFVRQLAIDELKEIATQYFQHAKKKPDLGEVNTPKELIEKIKAYI